MQEKGELGILSVFKTIDGEANLWCPGQCSVFVRTAGCTVGCHWCDTKYSWTPHGGNKFLPLELLEIVKYIGGPVRKVTLTGGEPLEQDWRALYSFIKLLIEDDYRITVETAGTEDTLLFRQNLEDFLLFRPAFGLLSFIVDYKLKSSKFIGEMDMDHFANLPQGDVVKFVIDNTEDFDEASKVARYLYNQRSFFGRMYFSPSHGKMIPARLMRLMMHHGIMDIGVGFNLQLQKYIWDMDVRAEENYGVDFTKRTLGREGYLRRVRERKAG